MLLLLVVLLVVLLMMMVALLVVLAVMMLTIVLLLILLILLVLPLMMMQIIPIISHCFEEMVLKEPTPILLPALAFPGQSTGRKRVTPRAKPGSRQGTHRYRATPHNKDQPDNLSRTA